jgi:hypothetical protein
MHRFVWDLRYTQPDAIDHAYPISAIFHDTPADPQGPMALPGTYTLRLTVDGKAFTQPLVLRADPRLSTSAADFAAELSLARELAALMARSYAAWQKARDAHSSTEDALAEINGDLAALLVSTDNADRAPTEPQLAAARALKQRLAAIKL